jgi:hypothetical protein
MVNMVELKFYKSPWKAIKLMLLCSPFVVLSLYDIIGHSINMPPALSWVGLCFFGLGIPLGLYNLFDRRPEIIINGEGIFDRQTIKNFLDWDFIENVYVKDMRVSALSKQKFLCVIFPPGSEPPIKRRKLFGRVNKNMGYGDISISISPLKKYDWQKITNFINTMAHADAAARQNLLLTCQL